MKKKLLALATLGTIGLLAGAFYIPSQASEVPPIVQEVRHQGEVLDNHEDRITNVESDVVDLQENTGTPQSIEKVIVREVTTPPPTEPIYVEPAPEPEPVVIVSYSQRVEGDNTYCDLTYSDQTTHSFLWQKREFNQVWSTTIYGKCDNSIIGLEKTNSYKGY